MVNMKILRRELPKKEKEIKRNRSSPSFLLSLPTPSKDFPSYQTKTTYLSNHPPLSLPPKKKILFEFLFSLAFYIYRRGVPSPPNPTKKKILHLIDISDSIKADFFFKKKSLEAEEGEWVF